MTHCQYPWDLSHLSKFVGDKIPMGENIPSDTFSPMGERSIKVTSYQSLVSHLEKGADVSFFFNTASCASSTLKSTDDYPVFGGELKLFLTVNNSDENTGQTIFSKVRYIDEKPNDLNEEIQSIYIVNDMASIFWGRPGFFVNNTSDFDGVNCNWTRGNGNIWARQSRDQKQLTSFKDIKTVLTSGEKVRWVVKSRGCTCPPEAAVCLDGAVGDTIRDFKIMADGSISFSTSMTIQVLLSWRYIRIIIFGHIYENNTANFMLSTLEPTTWDDGGDHLILCPITSRESTEGANFFTES
ncbi:uncharacterized protein LOC133191270 [Saccostrea echinata]|uniref:uncharacterized protein LOC133191270 n=1 Tax=Saccostrea echinata TaxID=191078 RepID=UPI002A7FD937|nr:uncharacterized protein LOC133191270 [Saccostrea echinata]